MKMRNDRVLVKMDEPAKESRGGIVLPSTNEPPTLGTVLEVGPGCWEDGVRLPIGLGGGDRVMLCSYSGTELTLNKEKVRIVAEHDILAVLDDEDEK